MSGKYDVSEAGISLLTWLLFLAILALIGTSIYVSVLAIPFIVKGLSTTLALSFMPNWIILLIALLPLIVSTIALLRFMQEQWLVGFNSQRAITIAFKISSSRLPYHINRLLTNLFIIGKGEKEDNQVDSVFPWNRDLTDELKETPKSNESRKLLFHQYRINFGLKYFFSYFNNMVVLASMGLGIFLAVKLMPLLMNMATVTLGLPYALAVLFGAAAAVTLIIMTYQLLGLNIRLIWIALQANFLKVNNCWRVGQMFYVAVATLGTVATSMVTYLFFWPLVNVITGPLSAQMAIFLAIAISVSLVVLGMKVLPQLLVRLPINASRIKENFSKKIGTFEPSLLIHPLPSYSSCTFSPEIWLPHNKRFEYLQGKLGLIINNEGCSDKECPLIKK